MNQVVQTSAQHYYLSKLMGFDYIILYKPSRTDKVVDALLKRTPHFFHKIFF